MDKLWWSSLRSDLYNHEADHDLKISYHDHDNLTSWWSFVLFWSSQWQLPPWSKSHRRGESISLSDHHNEDKKSLLIYIVFFWWGEGGRVSGCTFLFKESLLREIKYTATENIRLYELINNIIQVCMQYLILNKSLLPQMTDLISYSANQFLLLSSKLVNYHTTERTHFPRRPCSITRTWG